MFENVQGNLRKMKTTLAMPVEYDLVIGENTLALNKLVGKHICLDYLGEIHCIHCGRKTNKSFQQGYCFPCMRRLAECDFCIVRPEKCHYEQGTCRDNDWAHAQCMQPHIVYLANSTGLKVGITRESQVPTRWMDQGASQALPIFRVSNRYQSGVVEVCLKQFVNDKTNWRKLILEDATLIDLVAARDQLLQQADADLKAVIQQFNPGDIQSLTDATPVDLSYPVNGYPQKANSLSFEKTASISGILRGIKGQYLLFDEGGINIRKFAGYSIRLS